MGVGATKYEKQLRVAQRAEIRQRAKQEAILLSQTSFNSRNLNTSTSSRTLKSPTSTCGVTTLALNPSQRTFKLISIRQLSTLQEQEKVLLDPRFPYSPHENVEKIKALRREREKVKSQQILIRKQRDRAMHKLIMKAAQGDEKFLMKDINCDYEYDMLKRMRARAERDKVEDAAIKIQRFWKTIRSKKLFKFIVSL